MYTRTDSPAHIIQEVIDNSADEALGGHAKNLHVLLHLDGSITVTDDGRGIPVGLHPDEKVPVVVLAFTRLHAGGKFDKNSGNSAYAFSGGLHGVGVAVTNALSTRVSVEVRREGKIWTIEFAGGGETIGALTPDRQLRPPERHPGARLARPEILRCAQGAAGRAGAPAALQGRAAAGRQGASGHRTGRRQHQHQDLELPAGAGRLPRRAGRRRRAASPRSTPPRNMPMPTMPISPPAKARPGHWAGMSRRSPRSPTST